MALIDELKEKRAERIHHWDGRQAQISEHQSALREIEAELADLETAIAALEPDTDTGVWKQEELDEINARRFDAVLKRAVAQVDGEAAALAALEPIPTPEEIGIALDEIEAAEAKLLDDEPEPSLFDEGDDEPAEFISDLTGDPAVEPESGLHGDPEPTELDAEPASVLDNPELLAAVERAEATLAAEPAYVGLQDAELDAEWDAMKAREEAEKPKPRFSIFGRIKEDA